MFCKVQKQLSISCNVLTIYFLICSVGHDEVDEIDEPEFEPVYPKGHPGHPDHPGHPGHPGNPGHPGHHEDPEEEEVEDEDDSSLAMAEDEQRGWLTDLQRRGCHVVQVTYPRTANNEKELSVVRGEFLEVIDDSRNWWKCRNSRGQFAHVPHTIVAGYEMTAGHEHPKNAEWVQRERRGKKGEFRYF